MYEHVNVRHNKPMDKHFARTALPLANANGEKKTTNAVNFLNLDTKI